MWRASSLPLFCLLDDVCLCFNIEVRRKAITRFGYKVSLLLKEQRYKQRSYIFKDWNQKKRMRKSYQFSHDPWARDVQKHAHNSSEDNYLLTPYKSNSVAVVGCIRLQFEWFQSQMLIGLTWQYNYILNSQSVANYYWFLLVISVACSDIKLILRRIASVGYVVT